LNTPTAGLCREFFTIGQTNHEEENFTSQDVGLVKVTKTSHLQNNRLPVPSFLMTRLSTAL
jgi:hypothetical protein